MKSLDALRSISGLIVFLSHYFQIFCLSVFGRTALIDFFIKISLYAVISFFILSGFLISLSLHNNIIRNGYISVSNYLYNRFVRIYPPLIVSILMTYLIYLIITQTNLYGASSYLSSSDILPFSRERFDFDWSSAFSTLMQTYSFGPGEYLISNGPLWSLSYEVGFYLFILFIDIVFINRNVYKFFGLAGLAVLIFSVVVFKKWLFVFYLGLWLLGVTSYLLTSKASKYILIFSLTLTFGCLGLSLKLNSFSLNEFLVALIVTTFILYHRQISKYLEALPFLTEKLGQLSKTTYSLYIFHFPLFLLGYSLLHKYSLISNKFYIIVTSAYSLFIFIFISYFAVFLEDKEYLGRIGRKLKGLYE